MLNNWGSLILQPPPHHFHDGIMELFIIWTCGICAETLKFSFISSIYAYIFVKSYQDSRVFANMFVLWLSDVVRTVLGMISSCCSFWMWTWTRLFDFPELHISVSRFRSFLCNRWHVVFFGVNLSAFCFLKPAPSGSARFCMWSQFCFISGTGRLSPSFIHRLHMKHIEWFNIVSYIENNNSRLFSCKWALKENRKTPSISCTTVVEGYYRLTVRFLMYGFMKI